MKIPSIILFSSLTLAWSAFSQSHSHGHDEEHSHSHAQKSHDHQKSHDQDNHDHAHAPGHHATIMIPEKPAEVWAHINTYSKVVEAAAEAGDIALLHKQQLNLEALVGELNHSLSAVPEDKRKRVEGMINNAKRALGQLHTATDAKDLPGIKKHTKSLSGVLTLLKAQYPKDITNGSAELKDDIGPHEGMLAKIKDSSGKAIGSIELKLHDDKGDLELWIAKDSGITEPHDIEANTKVSVTFATAKKQSAILAVRNLEKNEGEDGVVNMREGKTNYFIFPGNSGESADWLQGSKFKSMVTVSFTSGGAVFSTDSFLLIPHGRHGHSHDH